MTKVKYDTEKILKALDKYEIEGWGASSAGKDALVNELKEQNLHVTAKLLQNLWDARIDPIEVGDVVQEDRKGYKYDVLGTHENLLWLRVLNSTYSPFTADVAGYTLVSNGS